MKFSENLTKLAWGPDLGFGQNLVKIWSKIGQNLVRFGQNLRFLRKCPKKPLKTPIWGSEKGSIWGPFGQKEPICPVGPFFGFFGVETTPVLGGKSEFFKFLVIFREMARRVWLKEWTKSAPHWKQHRLCAV